MKILQFENVELLQFENVEILQFENALKFNNKFCLMMDFWYLEFELVLEFGASQVLLLLLQLLLHLGALCDSLKHGGMSQQSSQVTAGHCQHFVCPLKKVNNSKYLSV